VRVGGLIGRVDGLMVRGGAGARCRTQRTVSRNAWPPSRPRHAALHSAPHTLHLTPYTLDLAPYTPYPTP